MSVRAPWVLGILLLFGVARATALGSGATATRLEPVREPTLWLAEGWHIVGAVGIVAIQSLLIGPGGAASRTHCARARRTSGPWPTPRRS
jgi:hypothetical protein